MGGYYASSLGWGVRQPSKLSEIYGSCNSWYQSSQPSKLSEIYGSCNSWYQSSRFLCVPGKTANECFHKFYSAHPTPPVQQAHARRCYMMSPIKKLRKMLSPSRLILQTKNRGGTDRSWLDESRKTMLRKQQKKDKAYEEDAFADLEQESRADGHNVARNHVIACAEQDPLTNHRSTDEHHSYNTLSDTSLNHKAGVLLDVSHTHSLKKRYPKLDHAAPGQDYSPEVLKKSKDMRHLDRYVNILICRHRATKKQKQIGKVETKMATLSCKNESLDLISAKAAVIAGARDILKNKGLIEKEIPCVDEVYDEDMEQNSHVDDDDICDHPDFFVS
ncbi:hypothetical protein O6H91_13G007100 [Diphasiastrum complanatum]|uniref:Uncharacterized protein n=1 Tax=Diphasiastrum complanatum TaxID=34168 RepID=A0ACC2BRV1_DIPCM|nr:hypothetical protein O6H91_13G007100 [Diphasiastrum complanatum]